MKYEVNIYLKNQLVISWQLKSITQVCRFIENIDMSLFDIQIYRTRSLVDIDPVELLKIWRIDHGC